MKKDINYYMSLPYNFLMQKMDDESGQYYFGKVLELDGCQSDGDTIEELESNLKEAMYGWISVKLDYGYPVPEPILDDDYSGKFIVRIPKSLHKSLALKAKKENISLNQYVLFKLSQ